MKKIFTGSIYIFTFLLGIYFFIPACNNEENNPVVITLPVLTTSAVSEITESTATCGGEITSDGGDTISARGVCWSTTQTPSISDSITTDSVGTGPFTSHLTGLNAHTIYYVRAYATNSTGTGYGDIKTFETPQLTEIDIDGHIYKTVTIGTQTWFAENLRVTRYRNGNPIQKDTGNWSNLTTGAYCWFNGDSSANESVYGKLYNWYPVNDSRGLCPAGWHVPTDADWNILTDYLGGESVAGGKLKDTTNLWQSPNLGATNETGFAARPGGERMADGTFQRITTFGYWWTSTAPSTVYDRSMAYNANNVNGRIDVPKSAARSVRCVRD